MPAPHNRAVLLMQSLGMQPDPWQIAFLESQHPRMLLNCSRQAGKSTVVAILALTEALFTNGALILLVSRTHRQSSELFRIVLDNYARLDEPMLVRRNATELKLSNGSRIVCVPCKGGTIRGFAGVHLIIIDEAAQVPDDIYRTVRPMLAVSKGRLICLSTPFGKRGFFWQSWARGGADWARIEVPATQVPRIAAEFLEAERRGLGESWFRQEYLCSFEALEGLVYPTFPRCVVAALPRGASGSERWFGGIDFGFRNPFAAVWGYLNHDGVLLLTGEHYSRGKPLSYHAQKLPRHVTWYCDPAGATERVELRLAGFTIRKGNNALRPGIAAVNARIESGMLLVQEDACPNLIAEAALYRYSDDPAERHAEVPLDEHNHALAALRYLIAMIDARRMAGRPASPDAAAAPKPPPQEIPPTVADWFSILGVKKKPEGESQ